MFKDMYPIYTIKVLNFIGEMAFIDNQDQILLSILKQCQDDYVLWVWPFLVNIDKDQSLVNRAKQKLNLQITSIQGQTMMYFRQIMHIEGINGASV